MKTRYFLILFVIAALTIALSSCNSQDKKSGSTEQTKTEKVVYTCPMHTEVTSDKPGKCPKCGMDLVLKDELNKNK